VIDAERRFVFGFSINDDETQNYFFLPNKPESALCQVGFAAAYCVRLKDRRIELGFNKNFLTFRSFMLYNLVCDIRSELKQNPEIG
jgi:hypothetical protein